MHARRTGWHSSRCVITINMRLMGILHTCTHTHTDTWAMGLPPSLGSCVCTLGYGSLARFATCSRLCCLCLASAVWTCMPPPAQYWVLLKCSAHCPCLRVYMKRSAPCLRVATSEGPGVSKGLHLSTAARCCVRQLLSLCIARIHAAALTHSCQVHQQIPQTCSHMAISTNGPCIHQLHI